MSEAQQMSRENLRRIAALQLASESLSGYRDTATTDALIARAEAFLAFIEPPSKRP